MVFRWQYQAKAEPVIVPAPPETITLDKWYQSASEPKRVKGITAALLAGALFFVSVVAPPAEAITLDKWFQPISQPLFEKPRVIFSQVFTIDLVPRTETITLDKWYMPVSQPLFEKTRVVFFQTFVTDLIIEEGSAATREPIRRRRLRYQWDEDNEIMAIITAFLTAEGDTYH